MLKIEDEGTKLDEEKRRRMRGRGREGRTNFTRQRRNAGFCQPGTRLRIKKATGGRMLRSLPSPRASRA